MVRPEYSRLAREFRILVEAFELQFPTSTWTSLDLIMDACECFDRSVDRLPCLDERRRTAAQIVAGLRGEAVAVKGELQRHLRQVGEVLDELEARDYFANRVQWIFAVSEELRSAGRHHYIVGVCAEGRWFLELFLPLLKPVAPNSFLQFFVHLGEVGNLVDKLVDARADYHRGEMSLYPGLLHHLRLLWEIARRSPPLFRLFPRPALLLRWSLDYFKPWRHASSKVAFP